MLLPFVSNFVQVVLGRVAKLHLKMAMRKELNTRIFAKGDDNGKALKSGRDAY